MPFSLSWLIDINFYISHYFMPTCFEFLFFLIYVYNLFVNFLKSVQGRLVLPIGSPSLNKEYLLNLIWKIDQLNCADTLSLFLLKSIGIYQ